jgi:hypothetical protein
MDSGPAPKEAHPGMTMGAGQALPSTMLPARKDRALPQIGRDVVKIGGMDGAVTFVVRGDVRARSNAKQGTADERHSI